MDNTMEQLPPSNQSIYFWMFRQGLKHIPYDDIVHAIAQTEHRIRPKDTANYWRGWYKSDLYVGQHKASIITPPPVNSKQQYYDTAYSDYPTHPFLGQPEIDNRYLPCSADNFPLIKWSKGCLTQADARAYMGCKYLGENLKGTRRIVVDVDGDHGKWDGIWHKTIELFKPYIYKTHTIARPEEERSYPVSFHLTFTVDKVIPTMHFPGAHIDIIGNRKNSVRYFKNKKWNGLEPMPMTDAIWEDIKNKIKECEVCYATL